LDPERDREGEKVAVKKTERRTSILKGYDENFEKGRGKGRGDNVIGRVACKGGEQKRGVLEGLF